MGRTLLHLAVRLDQFAVARWLLDNGAEVNATMGRGWTPLHYAARHAALELVALLVERGADPNATMTHGMSALHVAAEKNRVAIVDFLIRRGADSKAAMPKGLTALHLAVREGSIDTVVYYIQNGADVNLQTTAGVTLLHEAASRGNVEIMEVLLRHGADVHALDKEKRSALHRTLGGSRKRLARVYPAAKLLCAHGARWDADIDKLVPPKRSNLENDEEVNEPAANAWVSGMRVCVLHWEQQAADDSHELVDVPYEVVQRGAESVTTYLANLRKTVDGQLILRRKVCVVGPSQWGKTSLVKSLTSLLPSLVHPDHRTIGIDLFAYSFTQITEKKGVRRHEITFWDFAGQDEYQVAHALFFSKRTLYLVCIDLEQYDQKLQQLDACVSLRDAEHEMERFLRANVFRWVRAITSRQADAEFTIVGTKADTIQDAKRIQFIWSDLRSRLDAWLRLLADEIQVELSQLTATSDALCDDLSHLQQLHLRLNQLIRKDMIVMTSADVVTIERVRGQVEEIITSSDNSFVMPSMYTRVLDAIRGRQTHAARLSHAQRISHSVVPFQALCRSLMQAIDGLEPEECRDILQTLHDVGDLLWYQHEASGVLKDIVIIDPTLVLDFVREVITHEYVSKTTMANVPAHVVEEGRLTHAFLRELPLWRDADEELVFAFKQLLQYFQLAYPADGVDMDWDSDLIVPTYWKISVGRRDMENTSDHKEQHHIPPVKASGVAATAKINDTHHQRWEFELSPEVSETIFEQFAVQSYSSLFKRSVRSSRIETCAHGQRVVLATLSGESNALRDVIRIDVDTADETAGWQYLRYYVMALETVLDGYPGLVVSRYIVEILDDLELQNRSTNDDSMAMKKTRIVRHRLSTTIAALEDALWMGKDESSVYAAMPWLRQDLGWYVQRGWREPGALQQLRTHELLQDTVNKVDVLKKLVTTHDTRRRYPALWTLEYESVSDVMKLRMLSDLSGDCFHDPIPIAVPSSFLAKHGHTIKTGLSILSNIGPELISLGVLQKVIKAAGAAVCEDVNRSTAVHRLVDSLNVSDGNPFVSETTRSLAPQGAVALLRDLLRLHDPSFDDLMISDLSKLQCAVTGDGHYIWAHRLEIMSLGDKLTPCDVDDLSTCSYSSSHASTVPTTSTTPAVTRASSTTQANASSGFTGTSVHKEEPHVYLRIMGVVGLTPWDWRKIYCSWEIAVDSPHATTASVSASTPPHTNYAVDPTWNALEFTVPGFTSIDALSHCVLRVRIKRPSRCLGIVKQVGHGSVKLDDVLPYEHVRGTVTYSVLVPLDEESPPSRYVTCELKAHC